MNAKDILMKAVQCDKDGRILEAQDLYQDGIQILMELVGDEKDTAKKKVYLERIKEYIDRAEQIKLRVQKHMESGEIVANIPIDDNSTGHSYKSLFGKYLNGAVKEILIDEPYFTERYQFQNFIVLLELAVKQCKNLKYVRVVTKPDPKNPAGQNSMMKNIKDDLTQRGITLSIKFEATLHDRKIILSNGYIIKIGRGLHFFKPTNPQYTLGLCDYDYRNCLQTDVDICRTKTFS
ncbi:MIT domain-containing protein 1 [Musca vetustissima]|uniref:MIT domain-containing protein 1 n=1 Tax=Musca vetustissima TaxID=27455 RepID=UPI002AB6D01E|nr:MIT domain-containing protein 1 [Musca vetustissima]